MNILGRFQSRTVVKSFVSSCFFTTCLRLVRRSIFISEEREVHFSPRLCPSVSEIIRDLWVIFDFRLSNIWCQNSWESLRDRTLGVQCTSLPLSRFIGRCAPLLSQNMRASCCFQSTFQQSTVHITESDTVYHTVMWLMLAMRSNVKVNNCTLHHAVNWLTGLCKHYTGGREEESHFVFNTSL